MKRDFPYIIVLILVLMINLVGCTGNKALPTTAIEEPTTTVKTSTPVIATTPDLCAAGQIEEEINKVHSHMREFDDAALLASFVARDLLSSSIAELQRIRRGAEDEQIPPCLTTLKAYQIQHMNTVINTLIAFMGGGDRQVFDQGIAVARELHDQYTLELARLLGLTVVPATIAITQSPTPSP